MKDAKEKLVEVIKVLSDKSNKVAALEAMQYTQAALNAAHTIQVLKQAEQG